MQLLNAKRLCFVRAASSRKGATSHTFRHFFVTHPFESGYDIRTAQELLGLKCLNATRINTRCHLIAGIAQIP